MKVEAKVKKKPLPPNRILVFTGDGKGKTTAALGMVLRAAGHGLKSLVVQFVKADKKSGELTTVRNLPNTEIVQVGCGFPPETDSPDFSRHRTAAEKGLNVASEALRSGKYDLVVLDEIAVAIYRKLLDEAFVFQAISAAFPGVVIVLTGRRVSEKLLELADTVTEMQPFKHGMKSGWSAQKGVEF